MLEVRGLWKYYETLPAVRDISFRVDRGEIVGIIGPNGAGKTTLIKMICGLLEPDKGQVLLEGSDVASGPMARTNLGYVPEDSPVYEDMEIEEYLRFFASLYDIPEKKAAKTADRLLTALGLRVRRRVLGNLSKGMRRKVMIVRSLLHDPSVLVYDEPASGLDPHTSRGIVDYIKNLRDEGKAILFTGHNLFQVEHLCDRIILLKDGKVLHNGSVEDIKEKMQGGRSCIRYRLDGKVREMETRRLHSSLKRLMDKGAIVLDVHSEAASLEDAFLALTK